MHSTMPQNGQERREVEQQIVTSAMSGNTRCQLVATTREIFGAAPSFSRFASRCTIVRHAK